jgi:Asp-tRNA(Asn)/Glu-tRNA(Gln) amidotransferase A subunit family amidase
MPTSATNTNLHSVAQYLKGVPIVVKDEVDLKGFPTTSGTSFLNKSTPATSDAVCVQRMRFQGCIILGKTNMDEWGWSVFGINPSSGTSRNPHNLLHSCGGSSAGSAGAVAAGFAPIAIGADGGGSIRIPAAFCGVYGLKPTHARVPGVGSLPTAPSVGVLGPIAGSVDDLAVAYLTMAGGDTRVCFQVIYTFTISLFLISNEFETDDASCSCLA